MYCNIQRRSQNNGEVQAQAVSTRGLGPLKGIHGAKSLEAHGLYNRKGDVFDNFGSAFNNMKFRLICPLLTMPLRTNQNFNVLDYPDRPLPDGRKVTLIYTLRNFNAERNNKIHVTLGTFIHHELFTVFSLYKFMKSHQ